MCSGAPWPHNGAAHRGPKTRLCCLRGAFETPGITVWLNEDGVPQRMVELKVSEVELRLSTAIKDWEIQTLEMLAEFAASRPASLQ